MKPTAVSGSYFFAVAPAANSANVTAPAQESAATSLLKERGAGFREVAIKVTDGVHVAVGFGASPSSMIVGDEGARQGGFMLPSEQRINNGVARGCRPKRGGAVFGGDPQRVESWLREFGHGYKWISSRAPT